MSFIEMAFCVGVLLAIAFFIPPLAHFIVFRVLFGAPCAPESIK